MTLTCAEVEGGAIAKDVVNRWASCLLHAFALFLAPKIQEKQCESIQTVLILSRVSQLAKDQD